MRLAGLTGREPCTLDVRLLELRIRSQTSELPGAGPAAEAAASSRTGWRLLAAAAVFLALTIGTLLAIRRSRCDIAAP